MGKPIIAYSIEAALESKLFDEVMVSTDNAEIAEIAKNHGAEVPFLRTKRNADDFAILVDVIYEVYQEYSRRNINFTHVCCILPTAPFVGPDNLRKAYEKLVQEQYDCVLPILEFSFPVQRCLKLENSRVLMVQREHLNTRSQDLDKRYHDAGQFYWLRAESFLSERILFTDNSGAIIVSGLCAQDIDTETDWKLAELKYKLMLDDQETNL